MPNLEDPGGVVAGAWLFPLLPHGASDATILRQIECLFMISDVVLLHTVKVTPHHKKWIFFIKQNLILE